MTPWGQPTRGFKTRNNKRTDKLIVTRKAKKTVRNVWVVHLKKDRSSTTT